QFCKQIFEHSCSSFTRNHKPWYNTRVNIFIEKITVSCRSCSGMTQQFPIHEYSVNSDLERKMVHNMKDYYKINEIARLYGIGPDSLRYYEKLGLLSPRRDTNGYRLYNLKDMYKLTVIRDLRKLDFSMAQIREFLEGQCIDNTRAQLRREQSILEEKLQEMKRRKSLIEKRIEGLEAAEKIETG